MEQEKVVSLLDAYVRAHRQRGLDDLEKEIIRGTWEEKTYEQMKIPGYSTKYIKTQVGPNLWNLLTEIAGKEINKKNFKIAIKQIPLPSNSVLPTTPPVPKIMLSEEERTSPHIDWGEAPNVNDFYGRSNELTQLEQWIIKQNCRLVAVFGISGIGKTALVAKLVEKIQNYFEYVIWRSLDNAPSIDDILVDLLQFLSNVEENTLPTTVYKKILRLIDYLKQHRCLIILDQVEGIVRNGQASEIYRESDKSYGNLLQRIGQGRHNSCLVLTSQETLREIKQLATKKGAVREFQLKGLSTEEAKKLLEDYDFSSTTVGQEQLINNYRGHPLALKMAARTIQNIHNGNISEFLKGSLFMNDILINFLDRQFSYLSDLEQKILKYFASNSEKIASTKIIEEFSFSHNISRSQMNTALNDLLQRSIIDNSEEAGESFLTLEPIVKKYINKRLASEI